MNVFKELELLVISLPIHGKTSPNNGKDSLHPAKPRSLKYILV